MGKEEPETVKAKRHTPNQVIRKLREAELMLGEGKSIAEVAKALEVSEVTFHRWRNQYGAMTPDDAKRLKELERENSTLKRLVADKELEIAAHKEISRGRMKVKSRRPRLPPIGDIGRGAARHHRAVVGFDPLEPGDLFGVSLLARRAPALPIAAPTRLSAGLQLHLA